jgi:Predicted membrane protein
MIVATGLRFNGITFDSMWLDEAYQTVVDSVGINPQTLHRLADGPIIYSTGEPGSMGRVMWNFRRVDYLCPPLYFLALNRWMTAFGMSDFAIRSLSALFSLLSVAVVFFGTRKLFSDKTALFAAGIMAIAPYDIYYAQEARMYSLVTLTASISCFTFYFLIKQFERLGKRSRDAGKPLEDTGGQFGDAGNHMEKRTMARSLWQDWQLAIYFVVYAFSTWAMINSHYTTMMIGVFQGAFGIIYSIKGRNWGLLALLGAAWVSVLGLWVPWFNLFQQAVAVRDCFYVSREASWWWPLTAFVRILRNWMSFMTGTRVGAIAFGAYATSAILLLSALAVGLHRSPVLALGRRFKLMQSAQTDISVRTDTSVPTDTSASQSQVVPEAKSNNAVRPALGAGTASGGDCAGCRRQSQDG